MRPQIEAIIIQTLNKGTLLEFYQNGFDLPDPKHYSDDHSGFPITPYFGFDEVKEVEKTGNTVIWFKVDDIETRYNNLIKLGAREEMKPNYELSPGEILANVRDPDGNKIGLIQVIPKI